MKTRVLMLAFLVLLGSGYAASVDTDHARLKSVLEGMFLHIHSIEGGLERTLANINFASNRLVAAAKDVYFETSEERSKGRAMSVVSTYGTPEDVGFIISCATNHEHWYRSCIGVLKLCGVTSNSIARIDGLMHSGVAMNEAYDLEVEKSLVISAMLNRAARPDVSPSQKALAWDYAFSSASNYIGRIRRIDGALSRFDSTFSTSRRRLALLRYLQPLETVPSVQDYVAEEIRKLEALPEGGLND